MQSQAIQQALPGTTATDIGSAVQSAATPKNSFSSTLQQALEGSSPQEMVENGTAKQLKMARLLAEKLEGKIDSETIMSIINSMISQENLSQSLTQGSTPIENNLNNSLALLTGSPSQNSGQINIQVDLEQNVINHINKLLSSEEGGPRIILAGLQEKSITAAASPLALQPGEATKSTSSSLLLSEETKQYINSMGQKTTDTKSSIQQKNSITQVKTLTPNAAAASQFLENPLYQNKKTGASPLTQSTGIKGVITEEALLQSGKNTPEMLLEQNPLEASFSLKSEGTQPLSGDHFSTVNSPPLHQETALSTQSPALQRSQAPIENLFDRTLVNQVVKKVSLQHSNGKNDIRIELDPPSLGSVNIKISMEGDHIKAIMVTESSMVKDIVESNLGQLKQALSDQGVKVDQFSVLVGGNSHQGQNTHQQMAREFLNEQMLNDNGTGLQERASETALSKAYQSTLKTDSIDLFI